MMEQNEILKTLESKAMEIISIFENVSFRYEFDEKRRKFLVSYYPDEKADNDDAFWKAILDMSQSLDDRYGIYAPLFSYGEETFRLSDNAMTIRNSRCTSEMKRRPIRVASRASNASRL